MNKTIVLFDMDGTLTKPREAFESFLLPALSDLASKAEIGIVSGSDYNYIREQLWPITNRSHIRYKTHLLPCNGTKHYTPPKSNAEDYELVYKNSMKDEIGEDGFNQLIRLLFERQLRFSHSLPCLSGNFIDYRGSMINWCPIGRSATPSERKSFVDLDTSYSPTVRQRERVYLLQNSFLPNVGVEIKIGGETSFDIFPKGWDKTYCLKHFPGYDVWFIGDNCGTGGNDKELYDLLFSKGRAFATQGPECTQELIQEKIIPNL